MFAPKPYNMIQNPLNKFPNKKLNRNPYSKFITVLITYTLTVFSHLTMVKNLYAVWIKIDETLPWIELKGTYQTRNEARKAAKKSLNNIEIKIVQIPEKRRQMKALATIKHTRN